MTKIELEKVIRCVGLCIINHGQHDKQFKLGETINYCPSDVIGILNEELEAEIKHDCPGLIDNNEESMYRKGYLDALLSIEGAVTKSIINDWKAMDGGSNDA